MGQDDAPAARRKKTRASPVLKSDDVIERIFEAVSGGTPLAEVCREAWAPHPSTFYDWLDGDPQRQRDFARAREAGHDLIAARARKIARGGVGSSKDVKRDRLIVDTDLKLLEKWDKRYRPSQVLAGDPDAPLIPPRADIDHGRTLVAFLEVVLARKARAESEGLVPPFTREQMAYLEHMHPLPHPCTISLPPALPPPDGSDLA